MFVNTSSPSEEENMEATPLLGFTALVLVILYGQLTAEYPNPNYKGYQPPQQTSHRQQQVLLHRTARSMTSCAQADAPASSNVWEQQHQAAEISEQYKSRDIPELEISSEGNLPPNKQCCNS